MHCSLAITDFPPTIVIADAGQTSRHDPHPVHFSVMENGRALCWARFPSGGGTTHGKVLDGTPEPGDNMSLEMAQDDHTLRSSYVAGDGDCFEMFPIDGYPCDILPGKPVSDDDRGPGNRKVKTVQDRGGDMSTAFDRLSPVEGIGIRQEMAALRTS